MDNEVDRVLGISDSDKPSRSPFDYPEERMQVSLGIDFWTFRKMKTPVIIQVIFWIGVAACVIGGIVFIAVGADDEEAVPIVIGIALILVGPVLVRLWCELSILFFRMNETLTEMKNEMTEIKNEISKRAE